MKISASDWAAISDHFDRLADLPSRERQEKLEALELAKNHRRQLRHLLEQHDRADSLGLDTGAPERLGLDRAETGEEDAPPPDWQGRRLGPWQVDEIIGRGGMSVIHHGHRADGQFEKEVAVKVLKRANLIGDGKRLSEETRILARLEHPGIARLIDSGTSEKGHGYLVMELIHGRALDVHCRESELSVAAIVKLVIEAARALEYAHQRQVVHCDVKPANLLVRENGRLCVVDFGIAAMLQRQPDAERHLYCSPAYTAPERYRRAPPDTSQDIYSLGAVLEELIAGRSDRDLAAICAQATARQPEERYSSMTLLRADLESWQGKRPVAARRGGRTYVFGRWLQRHSVAASLGLLLVASLTLGGAAALWQAREARSEAARAVAARDFLIGIFESADPALMRGEDPPASELLRRGADRVRSAMADQPRLLAELLHVIGRTQLERGLIAEAADSLDEVLSLEETHRIPVLHASALSDRGMAAYEQGDFTAATRFLERSRALAIEHDLPRAALDRIEVRLADMQLVNGSPGAALETVAPVLGRAAEAPESSAASIRADALRVQGGALQESGRLEEAEEVLMEALALREALGEDDILLAKIENDLGIVHWYREDFDAAAEVFERSLQHKRNVYGNDHPQTLSTLGNLAGVNMARGDHAGAESAWRQSLDSLKRVHDGPHPDIAYTWGMLAWSHYMRDDFAGALDLVERGLAHRDTLPEADLPMVNWLLPLRSLILLELDRAPSLSDLQRPEDACDDLDGISSLQQRFCLARRMLETDPPGGCRSTAVPGIRAATLDSLPERWRYAYRLLRHRCTGDPAQPGEFLNKATAPQWLASRLEGLTGNPDRDAATGPD
ncbi:MAG: serine/threonine-protein kinase [Wenzhouxiangella sp.]|jgi:tetratricopeptide (TPR) repeat protein/predicted Ser/Thr protein kinase|nr:serine/threonine-protein kinase [Wenzhouxiangella sp.]